MAVNSRLTVRPRSLHRTPAASVSSPVASVARAYALATHQRTSAIGIRVSRSTRATAEHVLLLAASVASPFFSRTMTLTSASLTPAWKSSSRAKSLCLSERQTALSAAAQVMEAAMVMMPWAGSQTTAPAHGPALLVRSQTPRNGRLARCAEDSDPSGGRCVPRRRAVRRLRRVVITPRAVNLHLRLAPLENSNCARAALGNSQQSRRTRTSSFLACLADTLSSSPLAAANAGARTRTARLLELLLRFQRPRQPLAPAAHLQRLPS